jgi:hypothetical protein
MHDRRNGVVLVALALTMIVLAVRDRHDPGGAHALVELGLGLLGVVLGVVLIVRGRRA